MGGGRHEALVVTGKVLERILDHNGLRRKLLLCCQPLQVVIACRVTPLQKAKLVRMVRKGVVPEPITLSVGDGANDVGMIQEAHIGVGISGKEGRQAVNASDFAIGQFRFLKRLLLVHGRWNYRRICKVITYVFYKNFAITLTLLIFACMAGISGTSLYESLMYNGYNFFTMFPIIAVGTMDQDVRAETAEAFPVLYVSGRLSEDLNARIIVENIVTAIVHAVIVMFIPYLSYSGLDQAGIGGLYVFGTMVFSCLVFLMTYRVMLITATYTAYTVYALLLSFLLYFVFLLAYGQMDYLNWEFYYVPYQMMAAPVFWIVLYGVPATALYFDFIVKYVRREVSPTLMDIASEADYAIHKYSGGRDSTDADSAGRGPGSASSGGAGTGRRSVNSASPTGGQQRWRGREGRGAGSSTRAAARRAAKEEVRRPLMRFLGLLLRREVHHSRRRNSLDEGTGGSRSRTPSVSVSGRVGGGGGLLLPSEAPAVDTKTPPPSLPSGAGAGGDGGREGVAGSEAIPIPYEGGGVGTASPGLGGGGGGGAPPEAANPGGYSFSHPGEMFANSLSRLTSSAGTEDVWASGPLRDGKSEGKGGPDELAPYYALPTPPASARPVPEPFDIEVGHRDEGKGEGKHSPEGRKAAGKKQGPTPEGGGLGDGGEAGDHGPVPEKPNRPYSDPFFQQTLPRWQEPLSPRIIVITLLCTGIGFLIFGALVLSASNDSHAVVVVYDGHLSSTNGLYLSTPTAKAEKPIEVNCAIPPYNGGGRICNVSFTTNHNLKAPVYVNYLLTGFFQNYNRYATGHSTDQLSGKSLGTGDCNEFKTKRGKTYYPCGLAARSLFNDSYELMNDTFVLRSDRIAWKSDKDKYHNVKGYPGICGTSAICLNETAPGIPGILSEGVRNQHFMVWNRISALPDFMKEYGRIDQDIPQGTRLVFRIHANFPVSSFKGSKSLVLASNSWIGGRNIFLAVVYLVMGCLSITTSILFAMKQCACPRKMGSVELLQEYEEKEDEREQREQKHPSSALDNGVDI